ncbi:MAG: hypothetical protein Q8L86_09265 [Vicinamibacterales bacterium]|nr:hypothetical protein [Vicinamibacterales bacterium]
MLDKKILFEKGGRPVIYQPDSDYEDLSPSHRFRHKAYDPNAEQDFSWEREWRFHGDALPLEPSEVTLVVPTRAWADCLFEEHAGQLRGLAMVLDDAAAFAINKCPWHFIVLEDLGLDVAFECAPSDVMNGRQDR